MVVADRNRRYYHRQRKKTVEVMTGKMSLLDFRHLRHQA
jgi:hypothetical protein